MGKAMTEPTNDVQDRGLHDANEREKANRLKGIALVTVCSLLISFSGVVVRQIEHADFWQINFYRPLSSFIVVLVVLLFRYGVSFKKPVTDIGGLGYIGAGCLAVAGWCYVYAITTTTVANTVFTLSAIPFITALFARLFLKEQLQPVTLVTMAIACTGIMVMFAGGLEAGALLGNLAALGTAILFSCYAVLIRRNKHTDMLPAYLLAMLATSIVALLISADSWRIGLWDLAMCFIWGGLLSGIGNVLFAASARYLLAAEMTLFMLIEFALGPVWVWLVVDEIPTIWTIIGGVLIMGAVAVRAIWQIRVTRRPAAYGKLPGPT